MVLDIECYNKEATPWAQATFCYHGSDDVYWVDDVELLTSIIKTDLLKIKGDMGGQRCRM